MEPISGFGCTECHRFSEGMKFVDSIVPSADMPPREGTTWELKALPERQDFKQDLGWNNIYEQT